MSYGAGTLAAELFGAAKVVDPRPWASGSIKAAFEKYPHVGSLIPAMGYHEEQLNDLQSTINKVDCDLVLIGTPIDLRRVIDIHKPAMRVFYDLADHGEPTLAALIKKKFA
jgi:predicted GTPase